MAGHALTVTSGNPYQFLPIFLLCGRKTTPRCSTHNLRIRLVLTALTSLPVGCATHHRGQSGLAIRTVIKNDVLVDHLSDRKLRRDTVSSIIAKSL